MKGSGGIKEKEMMMFLFNDSYVLASSFLFTHKLKGDFCTKKKVFYSDFPNLLLPIVPVPWHLMF